MANTYPYIGPATRWAAEDPTSVDRLNVARQNSDHLHEATGILMDTTAADGAYMSIAAPMKVEVSAGVIWSLGWFNASDGSWWLLGRTADVASFTRAQANFYIPTGSITDVPAS